MPARTNGQSTRGRGRPGGATRNATAALALAMLLATGSLAAVVVWQSYRDSIREGEREAETAAQIVAAHMQWIGEAAFQALRRIDDTLDDRPALLTVAELGGLDKAMAALPRGFSLWLFDAGGNRILTHGPADGPAQVDALPYFRALREGDAWAVSRLMRRPETGENAFAIGWRIEREGAFASVAALMVPADLLTELWRAVGSDSGFAIALIRADGWLIARHPPAEAPVNLGESPLFTQHLPATPKGSFHSRSPGTEWIIGYYAVPGMPVVATVGLSRESVLEGFRARMLPVALITLPVILICGGLFFWAIGILRGAARQRRALRNALERNKLLLKDIHHRVKNNLAMVAAMVSMQPMPGESKRALADRISAIAAVHEASYGTDRLDRIGLGAYLGRQIEVLRLGYGDNVKVEHQLAEVEIDTEAAVPLGLIINEVLCNAFKHAFPDGRSGLISVKLEMLDPGSARLEIRDNGVGREEPLQGGGMGSRLIHGLSQQIDADYVYSVDGGTVFTMEFPLSGQGC